MLQGQLQKQHRAYTLTYITGSEKYINPLIRLCEFTTFIMKLISFSLLFQIDR